MLCLKKWRFTVQGWAASCGLPTPCSCHCWREVRVRRDVGERGDSSFHGEQPLPDLLSHHRLTCRQREEEKALPQLPILTSFSSCCHLPSAGGSQLCLFPLPLFQTAAGWRDGGRSLHGRDSLWDPQTPWCWQGPLGASICWKQGHLDQVAQHHVQSRFECLQGWRL